MLSKTSFKDRVNIVAAINYECHMRFSIAILSPIHNYASVSQKDDAERA